MAHTAPQRQATTDHAGLQAWVEEVAAQPQPRPAGPDRTLRAGLQAWVEEVAALTQPEDIHWRDGSAEEYDQLAQTLLDAGAFERLSDAKRPNSYLVLSDPADVARV